MNAKRHILSALILLTSLGLRAQNPVTVTVNIKQKAQTIQNFGASGCWFSDPVGKYWADSTKEHMAKLLFSKGIDKKGNLEGIGLSAWRFNIGAGTAEQGDSSGIKDPNRRVECFLNADGTYNWSKEQGYLWFIKKARDYGVENLIAFVNSPPVYYTQNGLGYKTTKSKNANLKADKYEAYANFLAEVLAHFNHENIRFNLISPVNEPQWEWYDKYGEASQEGSPYTNKEIYHVVKTLDEALTAKKLSTQILIPEAGMLTYLYNNPKNSETGNQIQQFWQIGSPLYLGDLKHLGRYAAGHGYFTEDGVQNTINIRQQLADTAGKYKVAYWQSEYSMLADGFKEGSKDKRSAIDCAIFLAKLIHHDLADGNASAWQFWNSWEPGKADFNTRYYLLALDPNKDFKSGNFQVTKNLWALGHYSRFIRPGMARIQLPDTADKDLLISAYYGDKKLVLVIINNGTGAKQIKLNIPAGKFSKSIQPYITTAAIADDMKPLKIVSSSSPLNIQPRAIYTLVMNEK
ncbi:glycoside hydrolase [Mucilaginibacter sp.]|uniref:glycoside hydrolase n=1 Tax=Mucilaginibacter sp. TaxID=1882438 RepID=UPI003D14988E